MITLITAVPGSGKSLTAVSKMVDALKEGRKIYTNLPLLYSDPDENGNTFLIIDPEGKNVLPLPNNNDWQLAEVGSLIIYDEAQKIFPASAKPGQVNDDRLTGLETHRHYGYDIIFITQEATFVHHHIRKLVGEHIHLYRGSNAETVAKYSWSHYCPDPNNRDEQSRGDFELWKFPHELYKYYKSSVKHTHKFKMPKKVAYMGVFLFVGTAYLLYKVFFQGGFFSIDEKKVEPSPPAVEPMHVVPATVGGFTPPPTNYLADGLKERVYAFSAVEEAIPVSGCVNYKNKCMCFSESGNTLELENKMCRDAMKSPLPRSININRSGGSSRRT